VNRKVLANLIGRLVSALIAMLPKDIAKKAVDALLDKIEDAVAASATPIDDKIVLPLCKLIRDSFDIPDED